MAGLFGVAFFALGLMPRRQFKVLFGCSRIRINPYVLEWIGVEFKLNSTPIHFNTRGLR
jgi:hypothetical protein